MSWRILTGDVRDVLKTLPDQSVQCVVTSPPYWGLRDYGHTGQIGLESTPDAFVAELVAVFAEVRRVLKDDGVVWLNLGDSYAGSGPSGASYQSETTIRRANGNGQDGAFRVSKTLAARGLSYAEKKPVPPIGLKSKDLVGVPWRVAFALQADGWYLRSDIIWAKPNPMPESVTDRPTKSHEYIFLLSKSERYYYDADAIREEYAECTLEQIEKAYTGIGQKDYDGAGVQNPSDVKRRVIESIRNRRDPGGIDGPRDAGMTAGRAGVSSAIGRNARSVWTITTQPYAAAHFATFPEALPERCIKAGSRVGDVVLDPFCGAGTTGLVADRLGRDFIGVELNPQYVELARERINSVTPLFPNEVSA